MEHHHDGRALARTTRQARRTGLRDGRPRLTSHLRTGRPARRPCSSTRRLAHFQSAGDRYNEATALNGLGESQRVTGHPHAAARRHTEALTVATRISYLPQQLRAHEGLALAYADLADDNASHHKQLACALRDRLDISKAVGSRTS